MALPRGLFAAKVVMGAVAGAVTGLRNTAAPHLIGIGQGVANASAIFVNAAVKAAKQHPKGIASVVGAGSTAVLAGHPMAAAAVAYATPVVVAAAPVAAVVAVAGGAAYGAYKLYEHIESKR